MTEYFSKILWTATFSYHFLTQSGSAKKNKKKNICFSGCFSDSNVWRFLNSWVLRAKQPPCVCFSFDIRLQISARERMPPFQTEDIILYLIYRLINYSFLQLGVDSGWIWGNKCKFIVLRCVNTLVTFNIESIPPSFIQVKSCLIFLRASITSIDFCLPGPHIEPKIKRNPRWNQTSVFHQLISAWRQNIKI